MDSSARTLAELGTFGDVAVLWTYGDRVVSNHSTIEKASENWIALEIQHSRELGRFLGQGKAY